MESAAVRRIRRALGRPSVPVELREALSHLAHGPVAVDCGANVGDMTVVVEMHDGHAEELVERSSVLRGRLADPAYAHVRLDWH